MKRPGGQHIDQGCEDEHQQLSADIPKGLDPSPWPDMSDMGNRSTRSLIWRWDEDQGRQYMGLLGHGESFFGVTG